jgi:hypothetical protein
VLAALSNPSVGGAANPDRLEVNRMPKYVVQVSIPTVYVIDARTEQQAMHQAAERFKTEHNTQLEPEVQWAPLKGSAAANEWYIAESR